MPIGVLFWVLMVIWFIFGLWIDYVPGQPYPLRKIGSNILLFILFFLIGWKVFGSLIQ